MRSQDVNVPFNIARQFSAEVSLDIFNRMCMVRYFEMGVIDAIKNNEITYPVYLSSGQEAVAAALSLAIREYLIFAQHRAHDIYLSFGAPPERLRDELLGLSSGSSQGKAGSNCLQHHGDGIRMFGHHGLIGENVPQGVGASLGSGAKTVCIFGDGAAEEDYVFPSMGFAVSKKLPVLFVCVDNNLSILTPTDVRRSWKLVDVAKSLGMPAIEIADDPWAVLDTVNDLTTRLPALLNCHVCRERWHVGTGTDGLPEWDRFKIVKKNLVQLGLNDAMQETEQEVRKSMERIWERTL